MSSRVLPISSRRIRRSNTVYTTTGQRQSWRWRPITTPIENENKSTNLAYITTFVNSSKCTSIKKDELLENVKNSTSPASANTNGSNPNNNNIKSPLIFRNRRIPSNILDDLSSRFIINTPHKDLMSVCTQIELAHWYYLDFYCINAENRLIPYGLNQFIEQMFQHIPFLREYLTVVDKILEDWKEYKLSVPTFGAILVSKDFKNVLLVQPYWGKSAWGFPKGKINEYEHPVNCAIREVYEETGFDITKMIIPDCYIENDNHYHSTRLYIIKNVPTDAIFSPRTCNEIKSCEWFPLDYLPTSKMDSYCKMHLGLNTNSFSRIIPFMERLKRWVNDNRTVIKRRNSWRS